MITFPTTTALGCAALPTLGALSEALSAYIPTRGDLEGAVARRGHLSLLNQTVRDLVPVMVRGEPRAAKNALEALQRLVDRYVVLARRNSAFNGTVADLRTIALFAAARHAAQAVTDARQQGLIAPSAPLAMLPRLSVETPSLTVTPIPPALAAQQAPMLHRTNEYLADDWSPIGAAMAGYGAACSCGYGSLLDQIRLPEQSLNVEEMDEDVLVLRTTPQPTPLELEQAVLIYPGAARALTQSFASKNRDVAARAFGYLRRERARNADILAVSLPNTEAKRHAARYMSAANALILHWAKRFHDRYVEEKGRTPPAVAAQSLSLKSEAMGAAAAVARTADDPHARIEKLTEEIVETAKHLGRAKAANNDENKRRYRDELEKLLARRHLIAVKFFDLTPHQSRELNRIVSRIMNNLVDIGELTHKMNKENDAKGKARFASRINANEKDVAELKNKARLLIRAAKRK